MTLGLLEELRGTAWSVAMAVLPLAVLFLLFQVLLLRLPSQDVRRILTGTAIAAVGLFVFLAGVAIGFMPFGTAIGEALGKLSHKWLLLPAGMFLGFVTTWAEPAVRILADQVDDASSGSIRRSMVLTTICIGVSLVVGLGFLRIGYGFSLLNLLVPGYALVTVLMWFCDTRFVAIAIDAGGVATGPLANTFLLALALGTSAAMEDRDPLVHGFGLVALIAMAPIISLVILGLLIRRKELRKEVRDA
jgi:hypothetical protein